MKFSMFTSEINLYILHTQVFVMSILKIQLKKELYDQMFSHLQLYLHLRDTFTIEPYVIVAMIVTTAEFGCSYCLHSFTSFPSQSI